MRRKRREKISKKEGRREKIGGTKVFDSIQDADFEPTPSFQKDKKTTNLFCKILEEMKAIDMKNNVFLEVEGLDRNYSIKIAIEALLGHGTSIDFINNIKDYETLSKLEDELTSECFRNIMVDHNVCW